MAGYHRIMLILQHTDTPSPALERAHALAVAGNASVHLFLFEHEGAIEAVSHVSRDVARLAQEAFLRRRSEWLQAKAAAMRRDGVDAHAHVIWGAPHQELVLDKVLQLQPDLVMKDVERVPLLKRVLLTPLDWKLLRLCPVPLMLLGGHGPALPRRVVVAVDPVDEPHATDRLNERLLEAARALPGIENLDIAHAWEPVAGLAIAEPLGSAIWFSEVSESLRELHSRHLRDFGAAHRVPPERSHLLAGPPAFALPALAARLHADLLVLGTLHRHGLERLVIGSTAERVLQHIECDILAVKPLGFAERLAEQHGRRRSRGKPVAALAARTNCYAAR